MDQNPNNPKEQPKKPKRSLLAVLLLSAAVLLLITFAYNLVSNSQYTQTKYSDFLEAKEQGQLEEVEIQTDRVIYMTKEEAAKPSSQQKAFYTGLPLGDAMALAEELHEMGVTVNQLVVKTIP